MPTIPRYNKCAELGCNNPKSSKNRFCLQHGGRNKWISNGKNVVERRAFNAMYDTKAWKHQRIRQLTKQPLCQSCLISGVVTEAKHVDHVFPWACIGFEAFTRNIFQSLCPACHSSKTHLEQRGVYRLFGSVIQDFSVDDWARVTETLR